MSFTLSQLKVFACTSARKFVESVLQRHGVLVNFNSTIFGLSYLYRQIVKLTRDERYEMMCWSSDYVSLSSQEKEVKELRPVTNLTTT